MDHLHTLEYLCKYNYKGVKQVSLCSVPCEYSLLSFDNQYSTFQTVPLSLVRILNTNRTSRLKYGLFEEPLNSKTKVHMVSSKTCFSLLMTDRASNW